jgi:hypothetical protein
VSTHNYDLGRQQIYTNYRDIAKITTNCLIQAFVNGGLSAQNINQIKLMVKTRNVPRKDVKIIAEELCVFITVKNLREDGRTRCVSYGVEFDKDGNLSPRIALGLMYNHYFLIEPTQITKYAFMNNLNYADWTISNAARRRRKDKFIDTWEAVCLLKPYLVPLKVGRAIFQTTYWTGNISDNLFEGNR